MFADLATHVNWLRSLFLHVISDVSPFQAVHEVEISVVDGLMAGTSRQWRREVLTVGSDAICDVQLIDDGVAERHARIQFRGSVFGTLAEVSAIHQVQLPKAEPLLPNTTSALMRLPVTLTLGDARIQISSLPATGLLSLFSSMRLALLTLIVAGSALIFIIVNQLVRDTQISNVAATVMQLPQAVLPPRADALEIARTKLDELAMGRALTASNAEDGSLLVQGILPHALEENWNSFRAWYDRQSAMPNLISTVSIAPQLITIRPIALVQLHEPATIYFNDGEAANIGDILEDGWTLVMIDEDGLTLERGNETTRIHF